MAVNAIEAAPAPPAPHVNEASGGCAPEPAAESLDAARAAGLRYVSDEAPGIRRQRVGAKGFVYRDAAGRVIRDAAELSRIRALVIPPAWTRVWICPDPRGHLQATGRDARGRKQYRYHPKFRAVRDARKYERMAAFGRALPIIRRRTQEALREPGLSRTKVLAAVVQLLEKTLIRVGNEEYARANRSYGLTTLRAQHVDVAGSILHFEFRGKGGKQHVVDVNDRRLARVVGRLQELPGQELFQYLEEQGERQSIGSADVNEYLRTITGEDFTAKDFRTWAATVLACCALRGLHGSSQREVARHLNAAVDAVAERLGNTRAICRTSYVHPAVVDAYASGTLVAGAPRARARGGLTAEECTVLALLDRAARDLARRPAPGEACRGTPGPAGARRLTRVGEPRRKTRPTITEGWRVSSGTCALTDELRAETARSLLL